MSLLPIIYTSLVLFFGLMLFVIIISYISYKIKAEKNPIIEEERKKINKPNYSHKILNFQKNTYQNYINTPVLSQNNYQYESANKKIIPKNYLQKNSRIIKNNKPRIQIMNNTLYPNSKIVQKDRTLKSSGITKFDLLKYYTDENELNVMKILPLSK